MSRSALVRSHQYAYYVTVETNRGDPFHLSLNEVWPFLCDEILFIHFKFGVRIHGFVLLPNSIHLLLTTPYFDLGVVMRDFFRDITKRYNRILNQRGFLFRSQYHRSVIQSPLHFPIALKHIYQLPVRKNLTEKAEEYPFSTLSGIFGNGPLLIPIQHSPFGVDNISKGLGLAEWLRWINRRLAPDMELCLDKGLRKQIFGSPVDRNTRKPKIIFDKL